MKITIDLPAVLLRTAKMAAVEQGQSLREFVIEAMTLHLAKVSASPTDTVVISDWMRHYGGLVAIKIESQMAQIEIDETFGVIDHMTWK